jgi:hypothetical protein
VTAPVEALGAQIGRLLPAQELAISVAVRADFDLE